MLLGHYAVILHPPFGLTLDSLHPFTSPDFRFCGRNLIKLSFPIWKQILRDGVRLTQGLTAYQEPESGLQPVSPDTQPTALPSCNLVFLLARPDLGLSCLPQGLESLPLDRSQLGKGQEKQTLAWMDPMEREAAEPGKSWLNTLSRSHFMCPWVAPQNPSGRTFCPGSKRPFGQVLCDSSYPETCPLCPQALPKKFLAFHSGEDMGFACRETWDGISILPLLTGHIL